MGSPTKCFAAARAFLPRELMAEIETRSAALRGEGMSAAEAARAAVAEAGKGVDERMAALESAGPKAAEDPPEAPSGDMLAQVRDQHPDLMVQLDGMDSPMRLDDFLAVVKAEADEMNADAPLLQVAAECALLNP